MTGRYEPPPEVVAGIRAAIDALPPLPEEYLDRIAALFADLDEKESRKKLASRRSDAA